MKWHEHEKLRAKLFAASVEHRDAGVVVERKGYTVRTRGDVDKLVPHEYECPVHGRFTREVVNHSVPSGLPCDGYPACAELALWCGSSTVGIGIAAGEVTG